MQYNMNNYIELYKICLDEACKISERRMKANQNMIMLNSALISVSVTLYDKIDNSLMASLLPVVGLILCRIWHLTIESYKKLNSAKFEIINDIETNICYPCFKKEWDILCKDKKYSILSKNEQHLPILFKAVYAVILLILLYPYYSCIFSYVTLKISGLHG